MTITDCSSTVNTTKAAGRSIEYIVIHYTAGASSAVGRAAKTAAMFAAGTRSASADYIVDDGTVVQYNPDIENRYCWHCGGSKYNSKGGSLYGKAKNRNSIGIEICSTNTTNTSASANAADWYYTEAALETARELTVFLMAKYGIDADHVIRHYDVTGKLCPGIIGWNADSGDESAWEAWHASLTGTTVTAYQATVTASALNVRSGPGTSYSVVGKLSKGDTVTVTKTSGAWAYIGTGWVSTAYLTKTVTEEDETVTLDDFKSLMQQYRAELQDNDCGSYSADAREWAVSSGLIQGGTDGTYMWEDQVTREQFVTVLYRFAQLIGQA